MTVAKGMTSGYSPIGAMLVSDRLIEPFLSGTTTFLHGITFAGHPVSSAVALANLLGIREFGWVEDLWGGGQHTASILGHAAMLVDSGAARTVVVYRALNGRSGKRMGQTAVGLSDEARLYAQHGLAGPAQLFALAARHFLHHRRMGADDLAAVAIQLRE